MGLTPQVGPFSSRVTISRVTYYPPFLSHVYSSHAGACFSCLPHPAAAQDDLRKEEAMSGLQPTSPAGSPRHPPCHLHLEHMPVPMISILMPAMDEWCQNNGWEVGRWAARELMSFCFEQNAHGERHRTPVGSRDLHGFEWISHAKSDSNGLPFHKNAAFMDAKTTPSWMLISS